MSRPSSVICHTNHLWAKHTGKNYTELILHAFSFCHCSKVWHKTVLILLARTGSSLSRKTSTRVAQVIGCLPLPFSHSSRISRLISEGSERCLLSMLLTFRPYLSSMRWMPKYLQRSPISFAMLIHSLSAHVNFSSSGSVGLSVRKQAKNDTAATKAKYQEDNMNGRVNATCVYVDSLWSLTSFF